MGKGLVTPVGSTPEEVLAAVREGRSVKRFNRSGFTGHSFFEAIATEAAQKAIEGIEITPRTGFILSTTKGDIEHIGQEDISLALSARRIAESIGIQRAPVVVSNACISGVAALLQGMRMIRSGEYDKVVVVGADVFSDFIHSGFDCLKALSPEPCRPFDKDRRGLNLGEAAAAMVLSSCHSEPSSCHSERSEESFELLDGVIRNDANHISGPSRTGEGCFKCLRYVMENVRKEDIAFISVHGTATPYNDEMESVALHRAGLSDVPVNALKGIFGHTMGAAGVLEVIVSMEALEHGIVLPTKGFGEMGVTYPVNVCAKERPAKGNLFIKMLSGFGGVNSAMVFRKGGEA
ncbi:MAG: beta-ketoacyl synthase [Bacteroidales bacterium]|nr:beta-ketoacyl synthase [Bacteroidales bacterium]